jgi:hypothetical protein
MSQAAAFVDTGKASELFDGDVMSAIRAVSAVPKGTTNALARAGVFAIARAC